MEKHPIHPISKLSEFFEGIARGETCYWCEKCTNEKEAKKEATNDEEGPK